MRPAADPAWLRPVTERLIGIVRTLVIVETILFMFYALVHPARVLIENHLALGPGFLAGQLWQPITALFVNIDFIAYLFTLVGLWFVGAAIERNFGRARFLLLFLAPAAAGHVVMALLAAGGPPVILAAGPSLAVLAFFVAFGVRYGRMAVRILGGLVMQARTLAWILVGFSLLADAMRGSLPALAGDVVTVALAYVLSGGRLAALGERLAAARRQRQRRRYIVMQGGDDGPRYLN